MKTIENLKSIGYEVELTGDNLKLSYKGKGQPDRDKITSILEELKTNKRAVTDYLKNKFKGLKHCTWLNKDVPSSECFDWCFKADRKPSTCEHFKAWWKIREKQLIEAGVFKC